MFLSTVSAPVQAVSSDENRHRPAQTATLNEIRRQPAHMAQQNEDRHRPAQTAITTDDDDVPAVNVSVRDPNWRSIDMDACANPTASQLSSSSPTICDSRTSNCLN